jgi:DHA3 family macrolide efflux protein-like MFS transporter
MLLIGAVVGLVIGLLVGGHLDALLYVRLRFLALLVGALVLRFGTQILIAQGVDAVDALRLPLYASSFLLVAGVLWLNRSQPGLLLVMVGVVSNGLAVVVNGGWMPVYLPALPVAGLSIADLSPTYHVALPADLGLSFLLHGGPIGDIIPFAVPVLANVVSIGDVAISIGLGWFVLATLLRGDPTPETGGISLWRGATTAAVEPMRIGHLDGRPVVLGGGRGPGLQAPDQPRERVGPDVRAGQPPRSFGERFRAHPYVRLMGDARFSAFWVGQAISMFGDRLHQIALGFLVLDATNSPMATGFVFLAATLPNLILGPIAGTFVDRWDNKRVMIVSDLIRAGLVLLIPVVIQVNVLLVYPVVFTVTTVSLFFRPARVAVVPRIVAPEDLLAANSALWTAESVADIVGYPMAALFVAFLGQQIALAFWVDSATYVLSAVLISSLIVPPIVRTAGPRIGTALEGFVSELRLGWHVMRDHPALLQNTLISTVAQLCIGSTLALTIIYSSQAFGEQYLGKAQNWAALEAFIGIGNLIGGLAVGLIGARFRKGRMVIAGFLSMGLATVILGLSTSLPVALLAAGVIGIANLVYVVPTQTIFGEVTPMGYLGRVVAIRSSLVFGAMTAAMGVCSILATWVPAGIIIAATGLLTVAAAVVGAFLPAVRDA